MLHIYIARHGQNVDNAKGVLNGHRDLPLTDKGIEQAQEIAERIKQEKISFDFVYASPLCRAFDTAVIIVSVAGGPSPIKEPLLIERDFGVMTGKNIYDIELLCAPDIIKTENVTYFLSPEGAETFPDMLDRAGRLLEKIKSEHKEGNILLVAHGDIGKMLYAKYYNLDWKEVLTQFHFGNCDLLLLSPSSPASSTHVFTTTQHN